MPDGCDLDSPLLPPKEFGVDLEWDKVGNLVPMKGQKKEAAPKAGDADGKAGATEEGSTDAEKADEKVKESGEPSEPTEREDSVEEEEPELTWSDVALYIGAEIVAKCRSQVHERLGYTCSAGIASNKVRRLLTVNVDSSSLTLNHSQMLAKLCSAWKKPNAQVCASHSSRHLFLFAHVPLTADHSPSLRRQQLPSADAVSQDPQPRWQAWSICRGCL